MVAVEGIAIAIIAVASIAGMYVVMSSNYDVLEVFNTIAREERESGQEDVDLNIERRSDGSDKVYIKNKSPTPVKITEMRILDDDGNLVRTCQVDVSFSGGEKRDIADLVKPISKSGNYSFVANAADTKLNTAIHTCIDDFDG